MYRFTDKQRQRLLEDALVADLLNFKPGVQPATRASARKPAPVNVPVPGPAAAA